MERKEAKKRAESTVRIYARVAVDKAKHDLNELKKEIKASADEMVKIKNGLGGSGRSSFPVSEARKFERAISDSEKKIADLKRQLEELKNVKGPTAEFTRISEELDKAYETIGKYDLKAKELINKLGLPADTDPSRVMSAKATADFQAACATADELQAKYDKLLESGKALTEPTSSKQYQDVQARLSEAEGTLSEQVRTYEKAKSEFDRASNRLAGAQSFQKMTNVASQGLARLRSGMEASSKRISQLVGHIKNFGKAIVKFIGDRAVSHIKSIKKHLDLSHTALGRFAKRVTSLAKRIFLFSVILRAFRAIRNAFSEGVGYYLAWDKKLGASVENLKNQVLMLKATFGGAFAPILEIVVPILSKLVGWLTTATNAIGAFIARLTGKSTYKSVVAMTADSGKQAASAVGDATQKVKELKKELADYDELHVISKDEPDTGTSSGGGSGGGSGSSGPSFEYADVAIGDDIKNLADKIKEMWARADFTELGGILGEKLKEGLGRIRWDEIKDTAYNVGASLATFINGGVEVQGLGYTIGQTIGQGLNTALSLACGFVDKLHFDSIGAFIRDGINGFLDVIEWEKLYNLVTKFCGGIADLLMELFDVPTFEKIGTAIGNVFDTIVSGIGSFFARIEGTQIGKAISGLFQSWAAEIDTVKLSYVLELAAEDVADFLNNVITKENIDTLAGLAADCVNAIVDGLNALFDDADFTEWGEAVGGGIIKLIEDIDEEDVGTAIGKVLKGALDFLTGALDTIIENRQSIIDGFTDFFKGLFSEIKFDEIVKLLAITFGTKMALSFVASIPGYALTGIKSSLLAKLGIADSTVKIVGGAGGGAVGSVATGATTSGSILGTIATGVGDIALAVGGVAGAVTIGVKSKEVLDEMLYYNKESSKSAKNAEDNIEQARKDAKKSTEPQWWAEPTELPTKYNPEYATSDGLQTKLTKTLSNNLSNYSDALLDNVVETKRLKEALANATRKTTLSLSSYSLINENASKGEKLKVIAELTGVDQSKLKMSDKEIDDAWASIVQAKKDGQYTPVDLPASGSVTNATDATNGTTNIDSTANLKHATDNVPASEKNVKDGKIVLGHGIDNIKKEDKTVKNGKIDVNNSDFKQLQADKRAFNGGTVKVEDSNFNGLNKKKREFGDGKVDVNDSNFNGLDKSKRTFGKGQVNVEDSNFNGLGQGKRTFGNGKVNVNDSDYNGLGQTKRTFGNGLVKVNNSDYNDLGQNKRTFGNGLVKVNNSDFNGLGANKRIVDNAQARITSKNDRPLNKTIDGMNAKLTDRTVAWGGRNWTINNMTAEFWRNAVGWHKSWSTIDNMTAQIDDYNDDIPWYYKILKGFQAWISSYAESDAEGKIYTRNMWMDLPQYATGGRPDHGTMFVAGENGAEVVGTINGRTEVLNKSQIAMAMYSAVKSAMSGFGRDIVSQVAYDTSVLVGRIDRIPGYIPDVNQIQKANVAVAKVDAIDYGKLAQALSQGGSDSTYVFTANLDGREIFRQTVSQNDLYKSQTGRSAFA